MIGDILIVLANIGEYDFDWYSRVIVLPKLLLFSRFILEKKVLENARKRTRRSCYIYRFLGSRRREEVGYCASNGRCGNWS